MEKIYWFFSKVFVASTLFFCQLWQHYNATFIKSLKYSCPPFKEPKVFTLPALIVDPTAYHAAKVGWMLLSLFSLLYIYA